MKKRCFFAAAIVGFVMLSSISTAATYSGGDGSSGDPYQISTAEQMNTIGLNLADWGSHFKLTTNIDMSSVTQYNIIGNPTTQFTGSFDGNNHVIRSLIYTTSAANNYVGLFGFILGGTIQNLGLEDVYIASAGDFIGSLAGDNQGTITNCYATGTVMGSDAGSHSVGGLVGDTYHGTITSCHTAGMVTIGGQYTGGLAGFANASTITNCYSTGSVNGSNQYTGGLTGFVIGSTLTSCYSQSQVQGTSFVGGLAGDNRGTLLSCYASGPVSASGQQAGGLVGDTYNGSITLCYATGSVEASAYAGGLAGYVNNSNLNSCYSAGHVSAPSNAGGLIGYRISGTASNCFWDTNTSGQAASPLGTGKTTAEMKTLATFTSAGWDFYMLEGDGADWYMTDSYPRLFWQPASYGGGSGTAPDPYQIHTHWQMETIGVKSNDWNKHFILMADIDMSAYTGTQYNIIGDVFSYIFTGTFDGNGHVISNLNIEAPTRSYMGLFGYVGTGGQIRNLGVENVNIHGDMVVGGLAGWSDPANFTACYVTGTVSGYSTVGGLLGVNVGTSTACYATAAVSISGSKSDVGGLVGLNWGTITACYAAGSVSGHPVGGGLVGKNSGGTITACFWDKQASGNTTSSGGTGKTTVEMMTLSTFTDAGWDFVNTWGIGNGQTYPYLKQLTGFNPADTNYSGTVDLEDLAILAANWLK